MNRQGNPYTHLMCKLHIRYSTLLLAIVALIVGSSARSDAQTQTFAFGLQLPASSGTVTDPAGNSWNWSVPATVMLGNLTAVLPNSNGLTGALQIPASSATFTDASSGAVWKLSIPAISIGKLTFAPPTGAPPTPSKLASGRYTIWNNGLAPDAGWSPDIGTYQSGGSGNSCQKWIWNGATLQAPNLGSCAGISGYMIDSSGRARLSSKGDNFSFVASGSGWIIKDMTTGRYLALSGTAQGDPGAVLFSSTIQTVWTATAN